jgi:hypothetical protein
MKSFHRGNEGGVVHAGQMNEPSFGERENEGFGWEGSDELRGILAIRIVGAGEMNEVWRVLKRLSWQFSHR